MKRIIKAVFKLIIVVIVLAAIVIVFFGRDEKPVVKHNTPQIVEKNEDPAPVIEEPQEEVIEKEEKQEEVIEEPNEEKVDKNSVRPEFKKSMEAYEAFFDEYIEFMNAFKKNSTDLNMILKYTEFLTKYEKAMSEMDDIDETELTDAEDKLFLDTQLRITNKLAKAAIDY